MDGPILYLSEIRGSVPWRRDAVAAQGIHMTSMSEVVSQLKN